MSPQQPASKKITLDVDGMTCGSCERHVHQGLTGTGGVLDVRVDLARGRAEVDYDPAGTAPSELLDAVRKAGYGARVVSETTPHPRRNP